MLIKQLIYKTWQQSMGMDNYKAIKNKLNYIYKVLIYYKNLA